MNKSHSKCKLKYPKQDICKPNSVIFLKGNSTPEQTALFRNLTEFSIQNAVNVIQTSTESRREITWLLIKHKQFNWREVNEKVGGRRGEPTRNQIRKKWLPIPTAGWNLRGNELDEQCIGGGGRRQGVTNFISGILAVAPLGLCDDSKDGCFVTKSSMHMFLLSAL